MAQRRPLVKRIALLAASLVLSGMAVYAANALFGLDLDWKLFRLRVKLFGHAFTAFGQPDDRFGWRLKPGAVATEQTPDFTATYTIGSDGDRIVPGAPETGPAVAFLGGSFTFGHGVDDSEVFPSVLQRDHWTSYRVRNLGCGAYGTSQVLLRLQDEFSSGRQISLAVYSWIWSHLIRNYRRRAWLEIVVGEVRARNPLFELDQGKLVFKGTIGLDRAMDNDDPLLRDREWEVTRALLNAIRGLCRKHHTRLAVVIFPERASRIAEACNKRLAGFCSSLDIGCLDLSECPALLAPGSYYPRDPHPTAKWHREAARLIAERIDPRSGEVRPVTARRVRDTRLTPLAPVP